MKNLKIIRKYKKMTQQQVASSLGISRTTYTQYETGVSQPDNRILSNLSKLFHVPISFLLEAPPFSCFETLIQYPTLLLSSIKKIVGPEFSTFIPSVSDDLANFISFLDSFISDITISDHLGDLAINIYPSLPLQSIQKSLSNLVTPNTNLLTSDEQKLIDDYRDFNDEGKEKVRDYVADLSDNPKYKKCSQSSLAQEA
ncbi:MAG: helix-turn-helix domain-containing protein [Anaerotruncus rubiinfantis]|jgi:transcriptional regulator with XRE-family HTH domain